MEELSNINGLGGYLVEVLLGLVALLGGFTTGVAWAHSGVRKLLREHDRQIGEVSTEVKNLREDFNKGEERFSSQLTECLNMHREVLQIVASVTNMNGQVVQQNNLIISHILKEANRG